MPQAGESSLHPQVCLGCFVEPVGPSGPFGPVLDINQQTAIFSLEEGLLALPRSVVLWLCGFSTQRTCFSIALILPLTSTFYGYYTMFSLGMQARPGGCFKGTAFKELQRIGKGTNSLP